MVFGITVYGFGHYGSGHYGFRLSMASGDGLMVFAGFQILLAELPSS
jgi:hypothetical protein